jgi:hypothetical protein
VALNRLAIVIGAVALAGVMSAWLIGSRIGVEGKSAIPVTQDHRLSQATADRPVPVIASHPASGDALEPQPTMQNEFAADDSVVQSAANDFAAQTRETAARQFATKYRELADRFAAEPITDRGSALRTDILSHLSENPSPTQTALQMECRQTICRIQITGSEPDKSKVMEDIQSVGGFGSVIGMDRPAGDGAVISDLYLVMH